MGFGVNVMKASLADAGVVGAHMWTGTFAKVDGFALEVVERSDCSIICSLERFDADATVGIPGPLSSFVTGAFLQSPLGAFELEAA